MSRIDQALSRLHPEEEPASPDPDLADPWAVADAPAVSLDGRVGDQALPSDGPEQSRGGDPALPVAEIARSVPATELPVALPYQEKVIGGRVAPQVVEEYRKLGALVHHLQVDRGVKVVMVTSAVAGEGKTLTATNLAVALSASYGRRVLLVDADLRRPSLHQVFNTVALEGLGDILAGAAEVPPLLQVSPRLTLLTAGRPNADPLHGLTSQRMRDLLDEAREAFDFVIIDTPPVGLLTDANLLAAMVDVALVVVRAESTPYELVKRATDAIGRHRIAGIVLNRAQPGHTHSHRYYTGYYEQSTEGRD